MRTLIVVSLVLAAGTLFVHVPVSKALPIDGVTLVGEQHSDLDQAIAAGKNGKTGKNGNKNGTRVFLGSKLPGSLFGSRAMDTGCPDLVAVDLR